MMFDGILLVRI